MKKNKCPTCGKPMKENTDGNKKYCQGHSVYVDGDIVTLPNGEKARVM